MREDLKEQIRRSYGAVAREVRARHGDGTERVAEGLYARADLEGLPAEAVRASLGCGVPTAMVDIVPGETVLDLGSGGGIDALLAARRVGPTGRVYGLDMTDEMLALARENQARAGVANVEFLKGDIEAIPLPDASVDVIISNCVINLAADKDLVFREAFRVLKAGGRFAVSDTAFQGDMRLLPEGLRRSTAAWCQCVSGALEELEYLSRLRRAGFVDESFQVTQVYAGTLEPDPGTASGCCGSAGATESGCCGSALPPGIRLVSGFVRARKPGDGPFRVREATEADLPAVRRLLTETELAGGEFEAQFGPQFAVAVTADGRVIGVAGVEVHGEDGLLRSVAVDPAWRGRGIGEAVVRDRLTWARGRGLRSVWLLTNTAVDYFPRFGFTRIDRAAAPPALQRSEEFARACPMSAVAMRL